MRFKKFKTLFKTEKVEGGQVGGGKKREGRERQTRRIAPDSFFHQLFSSKISVYFFSTTRFTFIQDVFLGRSESYLLKEINYRILNVERETNHAFLLCFQLSRETRLLGLLGSAVMFLLEMWFA